MTLEELESRKQELQGELSNCEAQLVEALKTVESLKQTKFSIAGAIALNNEYIEKTNDVGENADSSIPPAQIAGV